MIVVINMCGFYPVFTRNHVFKLERVSDTVENTRNCVKSDIETLEICSELREFAQQVHI